MNNLNLPPCKDNLMWDVWMSQYHLPIVSVADALGFFDILHTKKLSIEQLSESLHISTRATEIIANPLVGLGFLNQNNNEFSLASIAETYLISQSPYYWGAILQAQRNRDEYKKIIDAIHSGSNQLLFDNKTLTDMWKEGSITAEAAHHFTKKMHATIFAPSVAAVKSDLFNSTKKLLDVGGGSGCFSIAYKQEFPENEATVFELPIVCHETKKYIDAFTLTNKIFVQPGNFFIKEDWPVGFDGILLSQIVHDWPVEDCIQILTNAYHAMEAGGTIFIHEMLLDEGRASPLTIACFDLLMYINHKSQQFTKDELFELLLSVGFKKPKVNSTFGYYSLVTASK